jgi:hypothetical protein
MNFKTAPFCLVLLSLSLAGCVTKAQAAEELTRDAAIDQNLHADESSPLNGYRDLAPGLSKKGGDAGGAIIFISQSTHGARSRALI